MAIRTFDQLKGLRVFSPDSGMVWADRSQTSTEDRTCGRLTDQANKIRNTKIAVMDGHIEVPAQGYRDQFEKAI